MTGIALVFIVPLAMPQSRPRPCGTVPQPAGAVRTGDYRTRVGSPADIECQRNNQEKAIARQSSTDARGDFRGSHD